MPKVTEKISSSNTSQTRLTPVFNSASFENGLDENHLSTGETALKNIFIPSWDNKPETLPAVISLAGTPILSHQNIGSLIANPGMGKSSICEATCSAFINPRADNLGIEVDDSCRGVIYIDNERTDTDVWNSFYRMCNRSGISFNQNIENVVIAGLRAIPRLKERKEAIEYLLQGNECSLLLLDGAGDLVYDPNDLTEAIECRIWLRELTIKYKISIFTTIHPNPGGEKPRGHIGSEMTRESESVLLAKKFANDVRMLTSDFEHGKNRNNPKLTAGYRWSDEHKMFVSADIDGLTTDIQANKDVAKRNEAERLARKILPPPASLTFTELVEKIMKKISMSKSTAKRRLEDWEGWGIIKKHDDDLYRCSI